jgi:hypothetical protein
MTLVFGLIQRERDEPFLLKKQPAILQDKKDRLLESLFCFFDRLSLAIGSRNPRAYGPITPFRSALNDRRTHRGSPGKAPEHLTEPRGYLIH